MEEDRIKKKVREDYARVAGGSSCCSSASCCGQASGVDDISIGMGYDRQDLKTAPEGSNLGLGCGNPIALASLRNGEVVLDLGSGAGFDCFLAADKVGPEGKIIGVDMTPEMVSKARENAAKDGYSNVEFRLGEIESLPVESGTVDVVISNCVINLSPQKEKVFSEALRVLKSGGRIAVSDIVLLKELPELIKNDMAAYSACISGAIKRDGYLSIMEEAGFKDINILGEASFSLKSIISDQAADSYLNLPPEQAEAVNSSLISLKVCASKP
ncbi:MAG: arsenite methyltransferase [Actinomycetota bacterium]